MSTDSAESPGGSSGSRVGGLVRSGANLYLASVTNNLTGYIYWLVISRIAGPGVLGVTSAVVGLSMLIIGALSLGVNVALQKLIPECLSLSDRECARRHYSTALGLYLVLYLGAAALLAGAGLAGFSLVRYGPRQLAASSILVALGVAQAPYAALIALLDTKPILLAAAAGNAAKLALGIGLVALGYGWPGALAGYAVLSAAQLAVTLAQASRALGLRPTLDAQGVATLVRVGLPNWAPAIIALLGQWLGVLAVYGYRTAGETGLYYAAQAIASFTLGASTVLLGALLPVLSGMREGRGRLAWSVLRVALALIAPAIAFLAAYPREILGLLGPQYTEAAPMLDTLLLGGVPLIIATVIGNYLYAESMYRRVLALGLAQNLPRIALYPPLTAALGGLGAALSTTTGALTGLAYAAYAARSTGFTADKRLLAVILGPPTLYALLFYAIHIPVLLGLLAALLHYPLYARLGALKRGDIRQLAAAMLSEEQLYRAYRILKPIVDILLPE